MSLFLIFCSALALASLFPTELFAWGPITHLDFASEALKHVDKYPAFVRNILMTYPKDFLYGTLAADITVGKSYVDYIYNCHNWRVGFLLLNEAKDDRQKACALGYLSHLAADIIAHNFFVPYKTVRSYPTRTLGHVYWEMRFDAKRPQRVWKLAREICEGDFAHDDELFQRMLKRTLFSFKTNKRIFNSILNLHRLDRWHKGMKQLDRKSKWTLAPQDISLYHRMAMRSVKGFLKKLDKAPCAKVDPTGSDKLLYAKETRRQLYKAYRKNIISLKEGNEFLVKVKEALKRGVYKEVDLPEVSDFFV
jgi:hypothetical protein